MLDTTTKRRIDTARDILVGKVPDPKSQVEQITIALIYKFMDDMDAEGEELGGKRKFFAGDYERYGWAKLMRSGLGGHETLNLYAEAIAKMPENPGIPALFRDIFKNAYLPYRDPETLKSFLKIIDEFEYDHSERLGDAFEYLLSVLGSQGDAGQFRTPRHIIDFMVAIIAPKKNEVVLDPACGTAGFLISAYKHILKSNTDANGTSTLTPDDRKKMAENFKGYDISPDMVRLSLVNLYLHGFTNPSVFEYDTLTSEDRWKETADVILANPPFMSPKGGIKPHQRFSIQAKRSEVLFLDYIAEHLNANGRAAIIVPEGIIFQSQTAYVQLRKLLVENSLVAVVSLPAGMFNPYSGVKTSILILDRALAKQSTTVGFFKIENDGFSLGAQRREGGKDDLPQVKVEIETYLNALRMRQPPEETGVRFGFAVTKEKLGFNGEYSLSGERYRDALESATIHKLVPVSKFMKEGVKTIDPKAFPEETFELLSIPAFDAGRAEKVLGADVGSQKKIVVPGDVLLSKIIPHIRRCWIVCDNEISRRQIASTEWIVFNSDQVIPEYLRQCLISDFFHSSFMKTITGIGGSLARANPKAVGEIEIPLPPLDVQREIVAEIEGYQKIINGARAVLENYRPHIPIKPEWPMVELGEKLTFVSSGSTPKGGKETYISEGVLFIRSQNILFGKHDFSDAAFISIETHDEMSRSQVKFGDVFLNITGASIGRSAWMDMEVSANVNQHVAILRVGPELNNVFLSTYLNSDSGQLQINSFQAGASREALNYTQIRQLKIPLPPLATQQSIVAEIEAEQALVVANRELITRFEAKIQATLARVWGEAEPQAAEA
jgi:type I restriction enzyme M protein